MTNLRLLLAAILALSLGGCTVRGDDDDSTANDDDDDSAVGDDDDTTVATFPASPFPFTIDVSGLDNETVTVEMDGGCQNFAGSSNFRQQMSAGQWVVRISVDGSYDGVGIYDETQGASMTLQNNVAGGNFHQTNAAGGDTAVVQMDGDDGTRAWGTVTIGSLAGGQVTLSPNVIPIWCPSVTN
ncbi:MAG: hypothetical protein KDA24_25180 [Deltaproteobacteria bacterium]|nr:hypothetical protein [Deltaproteobacteria bacterium]